MNFDLNNLVSLLDDNDSAVYNAVNMELLKQGLAVIPELEKIWETTSNVKIQERLEDVIHNIQFSSTQTKIKKWTSLGSKNLLEAATYVAQLQYPGANLNSMNGEIQKISSDIYLSASNHLTAVEKVKLLNYVLFDINNFSRNTANYYSPQNSFINQVIDTRKGNPVSLGIIYLEVARKVGLPIFGVALPKCFVLAYMNEYRHSNDNDPSNDVLFYINPYNKGLILNRAEIDSFIKHQKLKPLKEYYVPCDNNSIIQRLIMNLIIAYEKMGFIEKIDPLKHLLVDFQHEK